MHRLHCQEKSPETSRGYDVDQLYNRFRNQDPDACRRYLVNRGIEKDLVEELITDGEVLHNAYQGKSYCCFCGSRQFQVIFSAWTIMRLTVLESLFWAQREFTVGTGIACPIATEAYITEGRHRLFEHEKTMEGQDIVGIALLGNQLSVRKSMMALKRKSKRVLIQEVSQKRHTASL